MDVESWLEREAQAGRPKHAVLDEMEGVAEAQGFPIIGPLVGRYVTQWAQAVGARRVFEMGSGFGYSTAWFAEAVGPDGLVVHTDGSQERSRQAQEYLGRMGLAGRCRFLVGDARALIAEEEGVWDVVFIDIDKEQYPDAWELAKSRVRPGGLVVTDNALWGGRVADASVDDEATEGVRAYVRAACSDADFVTTVAPLRDGVAVSLRV